MFILALALHLSLHSSGLDQPEFISDSPLAHPPGRRNGAIWCTNSDNGIYIFGGKGERSRLSDVWKYEPSSVVGGVSRWFLLANFSNTMALSGMAHWISPYGEKLWAHGGRYDDGTVSPLMWYYDVKWRTITTVPSFSGMEPRYGHLFWYRAATDSFYIYGGKSANGTILEDMWMFHPSAAMAWTQLSPRSPLGPRDDAGVAIQNDLVYIIGGGNQDVHLWQYNMDTSVWTPLSSPANIRDGLESPIMMIRGDHLVLAGGRHSASMSGELNHNTWVYTISTNTWSAPYDMPYGHRWGAQVCSGVVFGGVSGQKYYNDVWRHMHAADLPVLASPSHGLEIAILIMLLLFMGATGGFMVWWVRSRQKTESV